MDPNMCLKIFPASVIRSPCACVCVCVCVCLCVCVYSQNNLRSHSFKTHQLPSLEFKPYDVRSILALPLLAHVSPLWDFMAPGVPTSVRVCVCALWSSVIMIVWVCVCINWKQPGEWAQCFHKTNKKVTNAQHRAHHSTAGLVLVERQNKMYRVLFLWLDGPSNILIQYKAQTFLMPDIQHPQRMKPNDLGDPQSFPLSPHQGCPFFPSGWNIYTTISRIVVKFGKDNRGATYFEILYGWRTFHFWKRLSGLQGKMGALLQTSSNTVSIHWSAVSAPREAEDCCLHLLGYSHWFSITHKFLHLLKDGQGDRLFFPPLLLLWGLLEAGKQLVLFPACALIFFYSIYYNHVFVSHAADLDKTTLCILLHNISRSMDDGLESRRECVIWWDMDMCLFLCAWVSLWALD